MRMNIRKRLLSMCLVFLIVFSMVLAMTVIAYAGASNEKFDGAPLGDKGTQTFSLA